MKVYASKTFQIFQDYLKKLPTFSLTLFFLSSPLKYIFFYLFLFELFRTYFCFSLWIQLFFSSFPSSSVCLLSISFLDYALSLIFKWPAFRFSFFLYISKFNLLSFFFCLNFVAFFWFKFFFSKYHFNSIYSKQ